MLGGREGRGEAVARGQKGAGPGRQGYTGEGGSPPACHQLRTEGAPRKNSRRSSTCSSSASRLRQPSEPPTLPPPSHTPRPTAVNRSPAAQTAPLRAAPLRRRRRVSASDVTRRTRQAGEQAGGNVPCGPKGKGGRREGSTVVLRRGVWVNTCLEEKAGEACGCQAKRRL